jgi:hypothetical protein
MMAAWMAPAPDQRSQLSPALSLRRQNLRLPRPCWVPRRHLLEQPTLVRQKLDHEWKRLVWLNSTRYHHQ